MGDERIFGLTWEQIQAVQRGEPVPRPTIDVTEPGDYGADPLPDGLFRMIPSGEIVDKAERDKRLARRGK